MLAIIASIKLLIIYLYGSKNANFISFDIIKIDNDYRCVQGTLPSLESAVRTQKATLLNTKDNKGTEKDTNTKECHKYVKVFV